MGWVLSGKRALFLPLPPITLSYGPKLASLPLLTGGGIKFSWFLVVETIDLTEETTSTSWTKHKLIRCYSWQTKELRTILFLVLTFQT